MTKKTRCRNTNESPIGYDALLPTVFESVEEAVQKLKLDRRHKWYEFMGEVIYDYKYSHTCTGCDGGGCHECGYHGNAITCCPVPALHPNTGNPVKVRVANGG